MLSSLVSMITNSLPKPAVQQVQKTAVKSNNPFSEDKSNNPFLAATFGAKENYGKNQPVSGGYFMGYYNGQPNIVGRRLFIEV